MILQCYSALLLLKLKELLITEILPLHWYQLSRNCKNKRESNIAYTGSTVSVQTGALQSRHLVTLRKLAMDLFPQTRQNHHNFNENLFSFQKKIYNFY